MAVAKFNEKVLDLAEPTKFAASHAMPENFGKSSYDHAPDMDGYVGLCSSCGGELGDHMSAPISSARKRG